MEGGKNAFRKITNLNIIEIWLVFAGYPDPEVVWLCGDEPVLETPMIQIEYEEDGRCTLILSKVGPGNSDVYTCKASNDHGETCCSAKLIVQE